MNPRIRPFYALPLVFLGGCPQVWPDVVTCEEQNACGTTEPASSGSDGPPTTSEGVNTVTGDSSSDTGDSSSSGADPETSAAETSGTTSEPAELPVILSREVDPDYTAVNDVLDVFITAEHADGVRMELESGDVVELTPLGSGQFIGEIFGTRRPFMNSGKRSMRRAVRPWIAGNRRVYSALTGMVPPEWTRPLASTAREKIADGYDAYAGSGAKSCMAR